MAASRPGVGLRSLLAVGAAFAALLVFGAASAHSELAFSTTFGSAGSGAGQLTGPQGIAVDQTMLDPTSGDVYVADTGNARVEQFDSAGDFIGTWGWGVVDGASSFEVCTSACRAGLPGTGAGQFSSPTSVAVDSSSDLSQGDIYVGDAANNVVDKFSPSGSLLETITGPSPGTLFSSVSGVAVDENGDLWVSDRSAGVVYMFGNDGVLMSQFADGFGQEIAADAAGDVYLNSTAYPPQTERWTPAARAAGAGNGVVVDQNAGTGLTVDLSTNDLYVDRGASIDEFEAAGKSLGNFGSGDLTEGAQMAYDPAVTLPGAGGPGALYVADHGANDVAVFAPPPLAAPTVLSNTESATGITANVAALSATIDANGLDTKYFFEYGPTAAYGNQVPVLPGTDIGANYAAVSAAVELSGLTGSTEYHFRVVATNSMGTTDGQDMTFTTATPLAPAVDSEASANITSTGATLQAAINPGFTDTHYFFEYGPTSAYGTQIPLPPGTDIGESGSEQSVAASLTGLVAGTTYHFRVIATNSVASTDGPDQTFTTSPPAAIDSVFETKVTATTADLGAKINPENLETHYRFEYGPTPLYGFDAPVPDGVIAAAEGDQSVAAEIQGLQPGTKYYLRVVATNALGTETGSAQSFTTYATSEPSILPDNRAYELVSPTDKNGGDVGGNMINGFLAAAWATSSTSGSAIAYASFTSFSDAQSAQIITQFLASRGPTGWTTHGISPSANKQFGLSVASRYLVFTPELTAGVLSWPGALAPGASEPEGHFENLYVHQSGASTYELVTTVAPPEPANPYKATFAGGSANFSHVVFDANAALTKGAPANAQSVYEWVSGSLRLVSVLPGPGEVPAESAAAGDGEGGGEEDSVQENAVSADGSRIFWRDNNQQLYVREDGATTVKLNESQRTPSPLGDGSALFRGATPDGSRVFFIDTTPLTNGPNDNGGLYEYDFSNGKLKDLSPNSGGSPEIDGVVGISEDGLSVYFVASASLAEGATAGDDNLYLSRNGAIKFIATLSAEDSTDWAPSLEERTARVTPDGEHLALVSKAPLTGYDNIDVGTGLPDTEVFVYDAGTGHLSCASCNPSGARPVGPSTLPAGKDTGHIRRFISDDGRRVFFDSDDALVPSDTNGVQDVYEYENGSIYLISSGNSEDISTFADASTNGDNVFFTTRAQLVPEDQDDNSDLYDARVGGGFPSLSSSSPPCSSEGCRGSVSAPPTPLSVATEASGAASEEAVPAQSQPVPMSKPRPHKSKTKGKGRKSKSRKSARKSNVSNRRGHRRGVRSSRRHRRGGHKS